tara:strand:+ start:871 stop:3450 length:2580 start_codon:yes stop_codon:yes gene_type:complete
METIKIFLFQFFILFVFSCSNHSTEYTLEIDSKWEFQSEKGEPFMPASVPGTVHLDLLENGKIDDPFFRLNEHELQWIDKLDWNYRTTFNINDSQFNYDNIELDFLGLDTYADIFLNDHLIYSSDNMFVGKKIEVKQKIIRGENNLLIKFKSPIDVGIEKYDNLGYELPDNANDLSEIGEVIGNKKVGVFSRKAPYSFGWDWGPRLVTSGIWRSINVNFWSNFKINDLYFKQNIVGDKAFVEANVEVLSLIENKNVVAEISVDDKKIFKDFVYLEKGTNKFTIPFTVEDIERWWPNGMGNQKLYDIRIKISNENYSIDSSKSIGFRTIELITENDSIGNNFFFKVNGIPTFMKGVNYIPQDVFLPRVKDSDYQKILSAAVDANMNMIRVWGGGVYEDDIFYELCDKYGLLVWQDFMFACAMYPGNDSFLRSVEEEAIYNVKRIRNHPSLALWCGNNEVLSAWENWGWKKGIVENQSQEIADTIFKAYDQIFHKILPKVIQEYDPATDYWSSSPSSSTGVTESLTSGDAHYWGVWWGKEPFSTYEEKIPRFMSEFGFQSFPEFSSVEKYTNESDYNIYSDVMKSHQRSSIGNSTIEEYMLRDYNVPDSFEHFLYVSQLLQAEGISLGMEAQRRNRDICMGSLYWQLNDCWPVASWSSIDYYGKWKALHYQTKKSFEESILSFHKNNNEIAIYFVTDKLHSEKYKYNFQLRDFSGKIYNSWKGEFHSNPNNSKIIHNIDLASISIDNEYFNDKFIFAYVTLNDIIISEKIKYLTPLKNLKLTQPKFQYEVDIVDNFYEIKLISKNLIKNLFIASMLEYNFSDNYFDLIPNKEKVIRINRDNFSSARSFEESLRFISLYDTY